MKGPPWPIETSPRSSLEAYLHWLDGQAGTTGLYEYVSEPTGDDQPVLSVRYMDCPDPGTLLAFTFGISTVANPLWGGLRPELAICVDSTDPRWAWALADIGDRVRTTSVFLPGDTIEIGEPISEESPMDSFVLWHQLLTDDEAILPARRPRGRAGAGVARAPDRARAHPSRDRSGGRGAELPGRAGRARRGRHRRAPGTDPLTITVLSHIGDAAGLALPPELVEQVEVVTVPMKGELDPRRQPATSLISVAGWAENLHEVLARGVRWVHFASTGVDNVAFDELPADLLITNSRGASAVPIAEWTMAMMLAFEKHLPETWIHEPPENWRGDPRLGTLHGRRLGIVGFGSIGQALADPGAAVRDGGHRHAPHRRAVPGRRRDDGGHAGRGARRC